MNARDKELAKPWKWIGTDGWTFNRETDLLKFADLIRADEREALKEENWTVIMREGSLVTWLDAEELGERVRAGIRARGNI